MNLSWLASTDTGGSGMAGYQIYRNGSYLTSSTVAGYSDTGLSGTTTYSYYVRAYDTAGNVSGSSSTVSATTPDTIAPSVPANLSATPLSSTQVSLSWSASTDTGGSGLAGYQIFRNGTHLTNRSTASYTDSGLSGTTTYTYYVRAYDAAGNVSGQSATKSVTTPDDVPPSVPSGLSATTASPSRINLSWGASSDTGGSGLGGYRVYRNGSLVTSTSATSYSDTGLSPGTAYSYSVTAYDNAGNTSGHSNGASATTWSMVVASLSASSWRWVKRNTNPTQIDPPVTCSGSGGSGSGYTYAWQWVSGDGATSALNPASSSTSWTRSVPNYTATYTSTWRCLVTDSSGNTGENTVTVDFVRQSTQ